MATGEIVAVGKKLYAAAVEATKQLSNTVGTTAVETTSPAVQVSVAKELGSAAVGIAKELGHAAIGVAKELGIAAVGVAKVLGITAVAITKQVCVTAVKLTKELRGPLITLCFIYVAYRLIELAIIKGFGGNERN